MTSRTLLARRGGVRRAITALAAIGWAAGASVAWWSAVAGARAATGPGGEVICRSDPQPPLGMPPASGGRKAPPAKGQRPWWDWLGVSGDQTERSARGMPKLRAVKGKPWWDWMGVTEQTTKKKVIRIGQSKSRKERPWWDWMGVTEDPRSPKRPQTRLIPRPKQRPWWDWMGVTDEKPPARRTRR